MANITISPAGGNFNSTTTWIGGVIPTTNDGIIGNSASGNLTINVSSTIKEMRLDGGTGTDFYGGTITLSNSFIIGPTGNFYLSPNMGMTGSGTLTLFVSGNWKSYGFFLPCNISLSNNNIRTLLDDFNWRADPGTIRNITGNMLIGGTYSFNLWGSGDYQSSFPSTFGSLGGSFTFKPHNGTFTIASIDLNSAGSRCKFDTGSGTCSVGLIVTSSSPSSLQYVSGGWTGSLWVHNSNASGCDFTLTDIPIIKKFAVFQSNGSTQIYRSSVPLNVSRIAISGPDATDSSAIGNTIFHGGLSCSTLYAAVGRNYSSVHTPPTVNVSFASGATYTISGLIFDGAGSTIRSKFKSLTASLPATVNLSGASTDNIIISTDITDINFTGTTPVYAISGSTLTRTTGATTSFASGGAGGGPSSTTFLM